jgi:hypothetical protein
MKRLNIAGILFALLALAMPAQAIVVCHDYTLYRLTGKDPRPKGSPGMQGSGVKALRDYLKENGYRAFPMTDAAESNPGKVQTLLKPGDVIILREDHSGYVNEKGLIDHFIQVEGTSTKDVKYDADDLPPHESLDGKIGGLYRNETFEQFLDRPYRKSPRTTEVWRKVKM